MRYRGKNQPFDPKRKIRTREHVIADLSYNYLERFVLSRGTGLTRHTMTMELMRSCSITMPAARSRTVKFASS